MDLGKMEQLIEWAYEKAVEGGVPGTASAVELAEEYLAEAGTTEEQIRSLIRWQVGKCAANGFITNLGGVMTLPVAIPANVGANLYMQMRMCAAIAYMNGYNLNDYRVKSFVLICLCGEKASTILKELGVRLGERMAQRVLQSVSEIAAEQAGKQAIRSLAASAGTKSLSKVVPLLGGFIGAGIDATTTKAIGEMARKVFAN